WIMLSLLLVWSLRRYLVRAWQIAFVVRGSWLVACEMQSADHEPRTTAPGGYPEPRTSSADDKERLEFRIAFIGLAAGTLFLAWFSNTIGLSWWVALLFFGLFFLLAIALTRVRAEFGAPHEIYYVSPRTVLVTVFGVN